ncbi:SixA phosphatase family protein [Salinimicrobium flavum]|uniref:SixA phosphatase family protein n=1 Tax=Salinimicrobium flavum TaxID=1737065 RepID=A0ABW5IU47_9FLAO
MTAFLIFVLCLFPLENSEGEKKTASNDIQQSEMTTYYFIRHAEKDESDPSNKDPQLTQTGKERAAKWAEIFKEVDFDLIYSSDFARTRETAGIIAETQQKMVNFYDPKNMLDKDFQSKTGGKTVLIVGHSNTNPRFVNQILEENRYSDISEEESGSLFIVTVAPEGTKSCQLLYIN